MKLERLFEEVHYLALHYHWAEQAILDLPRVKRQRYLALLARHVENLREREDA